MLPSNYQESRKNSQKLLTLWHKGPTLYNVYLVFDKNNDGVHTYTHYKHHDLIDICHIDNWLC